MPKRGFRTPGIEFSDSAQQGEAGNSKTGSIYAYLDYLQGNKAMHLFQWPFATPRDNPTLLYPFLQPLVEDV